MSRHACGCTNVGERRCVTPWDDSFFRQRASQPPEASITTVRATSARAARLELGACCAPQEFYTLIPHISYTADGGTRGRLPVLDSARAVAAKVQMVDALSHVELATAPAAGSSAATESTNHCSYSRAVLISRSSLMSCGQRGGRRRIGV